MDRSSSYCSRHHQHSTCLLLGPFTVVAHTGSYHTYTPQNPKLHLLKEGLPSGNWSLEAGRESLWIYLGRVILSSEWRVGRGMTTLVLSSSVSSQGCLALFLEASLHQRANARLSEMLPDSIPLLASFHSIPSPHSTSISPGNTSWVSHFYKNLRLKSCFPT